jgi:hypothetical protein
MRCGLVEIAIMVAIGWGSLGCGGSTAPVRESMPRVARDAPRLAIATLAISIARTESADAAPEVVIALDARGGIQHPRCAGEVRGDAILDPGSSRTLLRLDRTRRAIDVEGAERFRVDGERLLRADDRAISLDGERIVVEGSAADLGLHVTGASTPALRETALVLIAFLATCEG